MLFRSTDGGLTWGRVEMDVEPKTTMFAIAFDERQPSACTAPPAVVFASEDGGQSWAERHRPKVPRRSTPWRVPLARPSDTCLLFSLALRARVRRWVPLHLGEWHDCSEKSFICAGKPS